MFKLMWSVFVILGGEKGARPEIPAHHQQVQSITRRPCKANWRNVLPPRQPPAAALLFPCHRPACCSAAPVRCTRPAHLQPCCTAQALAASNISTPARPCPPLQPTSSLVPSCCASVPWRAARLPSLVRRSTHTAMALLSIPSHQCGRAGAGKPTTRLAAAPGALAPPGHSPCAALLPVQTPSGRAGC